VVRLAGWTRAVPQTRCPSRVRRSPAAPACRLSRYLDSRTSRLREAVDLDVLRSTLQMTVEVALEPTGGRWLREQDQRRRVG
jgi:hypothetical protein